MFKSVFLLLCLLFFISTSCSKKIDTSEDVAYVAKDCSVYKKDNILSEIVIPAYTGDVYMILESHQKWLKVETTKGEGWLERCNSRTYSKKQIQDCSAKSALK